MEVNGNFEEIIPTETLPLKGWIEISFKGEWFFRWAEIDEKTKILKIVAKRRDKKAIDIVQKMTDKKTGVEIKDHQQRHLIYKNSVQGNEAVSWLVDNKECTNREKALETLEWLMDLDMYHHVRYEYKPKDSKNMFYFFNIPKGIGQTGKEIEFIKGINLDLCDLKLSKKENFYHIELFNEDDKNILETTDETKSSSVILRLPMSDVLALRRWVVLIRINLNQNASTYNFDLLEELSKEPIPKARFTLAKDYKFNVDSVAMLPDYEIDNEKALNKLETESLEQLKKLQEGDPDFENYPNLEKKRLLFLRARKFRVEPIAKMMKDEYHWRKQNNLEDIKPLEILKELKSQKLRWVQGEDRNGAAIFISKPKFHNPSESSALDVLKLLVFTLDKAMENPKYQLRGITLISDGEGSTLSSFDRSLPKVLLDAVTKKYPARIGKVLIVNASWFFKIIWALVRPLLSDKIASKVIMISSLDELHQYIDPSQLVPELGGTNNYDHDKWIEKCVSEAGQTMPTFNPPLPSKGGESPKDIKKSKNKK